MIEVLNKFGKLIKMITTAREDAFFRLVDRSVKRTINPIDVLVVRPVPITEPVKRNVSWEQGWHSHDGCCKAKRKGFTFVDDQVVFQAKAFPCWKSMSKRPRQYKVGQPSGRMINAIIYSRSYCR